MYVHTHTLCVCVRVRVRVRVCVCVFVYLYITKFREGKYRCAWRLGAAYEESVRAQVLDEARRVLVAPQAQAGEWLLPKPLCY